MIIFWVVLLSFWVGFQPLIAQPPEGSANPPPKIKVEFKAFDTPNDAGHSITVQWKPIPEAAMVKIYRAESRRGPFVHVKSATGYEHKIDDTEVEDGVEYYYRLIVELKDGTLISSDVVGPVISSQQYFDKSKLPLFVALTIFLVILVVNIWRAKRGHQFKLREIPGLKALDEAVGRAAEMGRPVLFTPGLGTLRSLSTIAALNVLSHIAKKTAQYNVRLLVPNYQPSVYTVASEVVRNAYLAAGRPDLFNADDIFYVSSRQFGFAAGVTGLMLREKTAAHFFMGYYYAESLILTETGAATGAIQIAGSDAVTQLPFFIVTCDYTLIGEELYAASAYLAQNNLLSATIRTQDIMKAIIVALLVGTFALSFVSATLAQKVVSVF